MIQELTWWGDERVSEWRDYWSQVKEESRHPMPDEEWRDILADMLGGSKLCEHDLEEYRRRRQFCKQHRSTDYSYSLQYLEDCLDRHIADAIYTVVKRFV